MARAAIALALFPKTPFALCIFFSCPMGFVHFKGPLLVPDLGFLHLFFLLVYFFWFFIKLEGSASGWIVGLWLSVQHEKGGTQTLE